MLTQHSGCVRYFQPVQSQPPMSESSTMLAALFLMSDEPALAMEELTGPRNQRIDVCMPRRRPESRTELTPTRTHGLHNTRSSPKNGPPPKVEQSPQHGPTPANPCPGPSQSMKRHSEKRRQRNLKVGTRPPPPATPPLTPNR